MGNIIAKEDKIRRELEGQYKEKIKTNCFIHAWRVKFVIIFISIALHVGCYFMLDMRSVFADKKNTCFTVNYYILSEITQIFL